MKILLITSDKYPPHRPAAKVIFGRELVNRGHEIDWLIQAESEQISAGNRPLGRGIVCVGPTDDGQSRVRRLRKHWKDLRNDLRMFGLARRRHYDIIQVKDKYLSALPALLLARLTGAAFCYWLAYPHGEASLNHFQSGTARYRWLYWLRGHAFRLLLYRVLLPNASHVFVQSEQMKRDIAQHGISMTTMTAIPGSLDLADVPYEQPREVELSEIQPEEHAIVYLGTLDRARRLEFLLRVHSEVVSRFPRAKLYLVGAGHTEEDNQSLLRESQRLSLEDHVVFTGHLPMAKAWEYIRRANVCVSPYYPSFILNSTSPTKLIEYMAMARPVVGNDHPEQSLVLHKSGAGICVSWCEAEFAAAICRILCNSVEWTARAYEGRRYVETERTNAVMADLVEQCYERSLVVPEQSENRSLDSAGR